MEMLRGLGVISDVIGRVIGVFSAGCSPKNLGHSIQLWFYRSGFIPKIGNV